MSDVWVVRADGRGVIGASVRSPVSAVADVMSHCGAATKASMGRLLRVIEVSPATLNSYAHDGFTVTLETRLTPAHAAVIEAAKTLVDTPYWSEEVLKSFAAVADAVDTLRAVEEDV